MAGRRILIAVGLAAILGFAGLSACGGNDGDRDTKTCKRCTKPVDQACFNECRDLCVPGDPDCDSRCAAQCDECRRDLVCMDCREGCTGTSPRCAPQNEIVDCGDGRYGGLSP